MYVFLFGALHPWLFERVYPWVTRDLSAERVAFAWRMVLYAIFLAILGASLLLFDYAKVRLVVEDRRSAIGGLAAAGRFVVRHPGGTIALFLANVALYAIVTLLYVAFAPGARHDGVLGVGLTLGAGQAYLLARLVVKLGFYATATAFFEDRLAHRVYTAPPEPVWPDSPAAEAVANGRPRLGPDRRRLFERFVEHGPAVRVHGRVHLVADLQRGRAASGRSVDARNPVSIRNTRSSNRAICRGGRTGV